MKLVNEFVVSAPLAQAWPVLTDIPRVARCLPGATLESSQGDTHRGSMTAKIGPVTATYGGTAQVREVDHDSHSVVMALEARELRGQGRASAVITNRLSERAGGTLVTVETDLRMSGAHAQFGRGILQSVAGAMIQQFAANLEVEITGGTGEVASTDAGVAAASGEPDATTPTPGTHAAALDVVGLMASAVSPRAMIAAAGAIGVMVWALRRRPPRPVQITVYVRPFRELP